jgi:hypothetical protein
VRAGKSVGTTDQDVAELLGDIGNLFDGSLGQVASPLQNSAWEVSNLLCDGPAVPDLQEEENQTKNEWDGCDLLMLAVVGPLLIVILSWWFPLSWPEKFSVGGCVKWVLMNVKWGLTNWWRIWWLRWGAVAVLAAALVKLLRVRARSKRRVRA